LNRLLIGAAIALVLILIVGGISWKAKWLEIKLGNAVVAEKVATEETGLGETLIEGLEDVHENSTQRRDRVDEAIEDIRSASAEDGSGSDGDLARARRSDAAWRRGIVGLCPECAPDVVGDSPVGTAEGVSGN
jgi:hypothetical protein